MYYLIKAFNNLGRKINEIIITQFTKHFLKFQNLSYVGDMIFQFTYWGNINYTFM